ncbi:hypothetical protein CSV72_05515 [Sporosarcina sp. P20a]|uniref:ABC-three component system middle component 1 n=1 Tax=Sporosarcina sp. P20a TaxID=2048256 RepID=UPI000C16D46A|nr:ABC-three component system middle component 1 [Sporosarcina sp. P20a]PIC87426.1 hypothetical protein CSV72_05515 [Sporosarcina sp. P20a]
MRNFNKPELLEILAKNNFFVKNSHVFKHNLSQYTFLYNVDIAKGIIIKEYSKEEDLKSVNADILSLRELLKKLSYNVWNVYYFILINNETEQNRKLYNIERDSRNMRKYILQTIEDLERVPFLNLKHNTEDPNISFGFYDLIENVQDIEIKKTIKEIVNSEGEYRELSKQKLRGILKENLLQGEML